MRAPDRDHDPALTWAGSLARRIHTLDRAELESAWGSAEGQAHRAVLKSELPDVLRQLVRHVQERLAELPPKEIPA